MDCVRFPISAALDRWHLFFDRHRITWTIGQDGDLYYAPGFSSSPYDPPVLPPLSADCRMASILLRLPVSHFP